MDGTGEQKYQINIQGPTYGLTVGDNSQVTSHFVEPSTHPALSEQVSPERTWNIPYPHNPFFTGREDLLSRLRTQLQTGQKAALSQPQAISGLGGIGKTQIAVEYAHRYHKHYQAVLWARAESHEALTSSFVEITTLLNLPEKDAQDQTLTVKAVKHWLQMNSGWLLILDNADEPAIVREFLPTKFDGHILLTTRAQALGGLAGRIEVDTMEQDIGALLLLRRADLVAYHAPLEAATPTDIIIAREIAKELGGLPLALDQAGAYIEETGCRLQDYQQIYQQHRRELLKERRGLIEDHPKPVATTWSLSFARVEGRNAAAAELLRFCAYLSPEDIAVEVISQGASHLGLVLEDVASDPYKLDQAIEVLRAYSLVQRDPSTGALSIHRLVQAVLRDVMSAEEAKQWTEQTIRAVSQACPDVEFATWQQWERYLPHAQACAELVEQGDLALAEAAFLLNRAGQYLYERARYAEAEPLYQRAFAIREKVLGPEHPNTRLTQKNYISLLRAMKRDDEAKQMEEKQ